MPDYAVASDIGRRLAELREFLGEGQREFAARFGRGWKQVSMWERGHQRPRPSVLRIAADKNGWPDGIFWEGGPRPAETLRKGPSSPAGALSGEGPTRSPSRRKEDREGYARAVVLDRRLAFLRDTLRAYAVNGQPLPPAVAEELLHATADAMDVTKLLASPARNGLPPASPPPES